MNHPDTSTPTRGENAFDFSQISAYLAFMGVSITAVYIYFSNHYQNRWFTVFLLLLFAFLFTTNQYYRSRLARWYSFIYLCFQTMIAGILMMLPPFTGIFVFLFFILSAEAMAYSSTRAGFIWIGIFTIISGYSLTVINGFKNAIYTLPIYLGGYLFFGFFAVLRERAEVSKRESLKLLAELQLTHRQLKEYTTRVEELTVAEERNRLARDMHDTVGHRLTIAAVQLEGAQRLIMTNPDKAFEMIGTVQKQVRQALQELRNTVTTLREPLEIDVSLEHSMSQLAEKFQTHTDLKINLRLDTDLGPFPSSYRIAFYRVAQEALTNIQRHAQAQQVDISLQRQDDRLTLHVKNDGIGTKKVQSAKGFGLIGMRERASLLGGEVLFLSSEGKGTEVVFSLPVPVEDTNA